MGSSKRTTPIKKAKNTKASDSARLKKEDEPKPRKK
jgi:hypothetical protein